MKARILVVDDDLLSCSTTKQVLEAAGHVVQLARTSEAGLTYLHADIPDLVLLNVNMPDIDGFEMLRRIKNDPHLGFVFVVLVSGSRTDTDSQISGLEAGADGYLTWPLSDRELLARIESTLRIKSAEDTIRQKERQLQDLIASNLDGMLVLDQSGSTLFANPAACTLLDRTPESIENQYVGIPITGGEHTELALVRPDGGHRVVEMRVTEIEWNNEPAFLATLRDVTERRHLEEMRQQYAERLEAEVALRTQELQDAQEQLVRQERLAVLGRLASSVGHELRNPLAVISNAVYFLRLIQPQADAKIQEYLELIESEIRVADKIVRDLLDFSRVHTVERERIYIAQLIQMALRRFPAPPHIHIELQIPDDLPRLHADLQQLEQVLGNLLVNAYQAMPTGGELKISAARSSPPDGNWVAITVRDTGVGIAPEHLGRLFEPLFTTKARGIGLGLAVSQKLIEANGGRIEAESELGKGSAFTLTLPGEEAIP